MPLSEKEKIDRELVGNIQNGNEVDANLNSLIERHSGIYYSVLQGFSKTAITTNMDMEYLTGSCAFTIYEAALKFDHRKTIKFSSFLGIWTRWTILDHIKQSRKLIPFKQSELDHLEAENDGGSEEDLSRLLDEESLRLVLGEIKENCDPRTYELFRLRYIDAEGNRVRPWREVCEHIKSSRNPKKSITIQGCIMLHNKTLEKIKDGLKLE